MANGRERREEDEGYQPESRAYTRELDPNRQADSTNRPPMSEDLALQQALQHKAEAEEAARLRAEGESRVQFWPNVGRFVIPAENTFAAHAQLIDKGYIAFDPSAYPYTLNVMVDAAQRPDLFDPGHRDYEKNATARRNLLVLFNDITGMYLADGAFNPGDEKYIPQITSIAQAVGDGLRHEKSPAGRLFFQHLNTDYLNIEGEGAAHAYKFLLERQRSPGVFAALRRNLRRITDLPLREWGLPPIAETPFSQTALDAPAPPDVLCMTETQLAEHCRGRCQPCAVGQNWRGRVAPPPGAPGYARVV